MLSTHGGSKGSVSLSTFVQNLSHMHAKIPSNHLRQNHVLPHENLMRSAYMQMIPSRQL